METTALYHPVKIGNLELSGNLFLAPIAGYSDRAFRSICYDCGADFAYTEMVSAEAIIRTSSKTEHLMSRAPNEKKYAIQLFGSNVTSMKDAASFIMENYSPELIDINAGCPVPKIVKTGAGSALTRDFDKLSKVVEAVREGVKDKIPVSVKIRSGWDSSNLTWKEAAFAAADAGAKAITIHPRTRAQGYEGKSNWSILKDLVYLMKDKIPVFGSGDIFSPEDAVKMLEETKCDGVMFARGAMGNPFIFTETKQLLLEGRYDEISPRKRIETGMTELYQLVEDKGEQVGCKEMRKRFCAYTKGIKGGSQLRVDIISADTIKDYEILFSSFLVE